MVRIRRVTKKRITRKLTLDFTYLVARCLHILWPVNSHMGVRVSEGEGLNESWKL